MKMARLSMRDFFAAQTMANFPPTSADIVRLQQGEKADHKFMAEFCYAAADAMLEARKKKGRK